MEKLTKIAITGHSGSGKSTVTNMLVKNLQDTKVLHLDLPFIMSPLKFKKEFERTFDMPLNTKDHINCLRIAMDKDPTGKALREYFDIIKNFTNEEIEKEIQTISNDKIKYLIAEYFALPTLQFWDDAKYRIMVDAPHKERNERLVEREKNDDISPFYNEHCGEIRENALRPIMARATNNNYLIYNTFDEHLEKEVNYIGEKIKNDQELNLPL
jgi:dephospho-CoA kinase